MKTMGPIATEEDLNRCGAVIEFLLCDASGNHKADGDIINDSGSLVGRATYIRNKHLDSLIRERPEEVKAIIDYVKDRGMHPANKGPVTQLREYLEETAEATSVGSGWL